MAVLYVMMLNFNKREKMKKIYMPFNCDEDIAEFIKKDAEQERISASQVIRKILLKHYEKELQKKK